MRKVKDMRAALLAKGFRSENTHHEMFWFFCGDKKTQIHTRFSQGAKECDDFICGAIRKQIRLTRAQFDGFMDCHIGYDEYLNIVTTNGDVIEPPPPAAAPGKKRRQK